MKERSGYIFESEGKWYARITLTDQFGKRRNVKRTAPTKAEARKVLAKLQRELKPGREAEAINALRMTFADLCDYYEANYAKAPKFENDQKVEGLRDYRRVKSFIGLFRAHFGTKKLNDITYDAVKTFRTRRLNTPSHRGERSITSVNRELTYLRRIFNVALRQGWIDRNPFSCGEPLILVSCERKRERVLTPDEERRLLAACDHPMRRHLRPLLIALLDTGARKGEMLKLTWEDVDLEAGIITIRAMNTKTLRERRVPITARLRRELEALRGNTGKLVFGIQSDVKRSFATACKEAGIESGGISGLNIHSLRHTAASRLVQGQMPIELVGRILGHTQPQTTYRYISANRGALEAAKSILEAVFS